MLLVVTAAPGPLPQLDGATIRSVAEAMGLAPADVRMRLSGVLPRVLHSAASAADLEARVSALRGAGFSALVVDPRAAPTDAERIIGRRVQTSGSVLQVWDGGDVCHECPRPAVALIQRGVRITTEQRTVTSTQQKLDPGRAILTGGLILTKKTTTSSTVSNETREPFLLIQRNDGDGDLMLYERRLDYRGGPDVVQPSSHANFELLVARLRAFFPGVPFDERVAQPAFITSLPSTGADATDLGLYLVALANLRA